MNNLPPGQSPTGAGAGRTSSNQGIKQSAQSPTGAGAGRDRRKPMEATKTRKVGRPAMAEDEKRKKHSVICAPGTKDLAEKIAAHEGLPGWGHAVDQAIELLAKNLGILEDQ